MNFIDLTMRNLGLEIRLSSYIIAMVKYGNLTNFKIQAKHLKSHCALHMRNLSQNICSYFLENFVPDASREKIKTDSRMGQSGKSDELIFLKKILTFEDSLQVSRPLNSTIHGIEILCPTAPHHGEL